jgi:hypothetical protein
MWKFLQQDEPVDLIIYSGKSVLCKDVVEYVLDILIYDEIKKN